MLRRALLVLCLGALVATTAVGQEEATLAAADVTEKVVFGSPEWVKIARTVLEELVAEHGEIGRSFSACEVFTDSPPGMAGPDETTAAWHFRIVGKTVTVGEGEIEGADLDVRVAYEAALPMARFVYTPELIERMRAAPQAEGDSAGDRPDMPTYLVELHNRMAVVTQ